jgi:predicted transcriptional regulator
LQTLVDVATAAAEAQHRQLELNLAVPDHLPKNREVQRLAREISQAERDLERLQEQQQWEMVKFAEVVARVMQGTPGMARSLRMPLAVEQALLGLSAGE